MRVKICGITSLEDALAACEAGADALGFNFAEEAMARNRYISPDAAEQIIGQLPPFVKTVAVCVNPRPAEVTRYLGFVDCIQFHGEESPQDCAQAGVRALKAFRLHPDFVAEQVLAYPGRACLVDAYVPDTRGGSGKTCDWAAARRVRALGKPVILAGGLTPENVSEAIAAVEPSAVDTAGGVESAPGRKDHDKLREFIRNAKAALSLS